MTPTKTYVSWEAVHERVAASLFVDKASLNPAWASLCAQATKDAAAEIKRIYVLKGFTPAQVAASDDSRAYCERLGAFFALVRGTALASYDLKSVEHLDCRKEMAEAGALVIDDAAVSPATGGSDVGGIASGAIDAVECARDRFDAL